MNYFCGLMLAFATFAATSAVYAQAPVRPDAQASVRPEAYTAGLIAYRSGRFAEAVTSMAAAESVAPGQTDALLFKARALLSLGSVSDAQQAIRTYIQGHVNSADAHSLLGYCLYREDRAKDSLAEYRASAALRTPPADDIEVVAADYVILADFADADIWLTRVTQQKPFDEQAWYYLGRTKYNENRFAEALEAFTTCLKLSLRNVRAEDNLGLVYQGMQREDEAIDAFQKAIEWEAAAEHPSAQPYLNLGILLMQQGKQEMALPQLQRAVALAPKNPKAHEQLGRCFSQLKKLKEAQAELESAVELAPKAPTVHFELGQVYHREGMEDQAKREFALTAQLNGSRSAEKTPSPDTSE
jgi:tetratricopeptide (TPR) repeat protein